MNREAALKRFDLSGKVAWVIGGGGVRLGGAVSMALAEHGAMVVVCDVKTEAAEAMAERIRAAGGQAEGRGLDVGDESQVKACADGIAERHGRLDVMVNMAAHARNHDGVGMDKSLDEWNACMRVTLGGAFLASREAGRVMRGFGGGSIVQFGSMYGCVSPVPALYPPATPVNPPEYGAAKAGVLQLVRYQAVAMAPYGVRVNAVVPGPFPGERHEDDPTFLQNLQKQVPMGRVGDMHEITGAVVLLCSDASSYMTGTHIAVDGGWLAQ